MHDPRGYPPGVHSPNLPDAIHSLPSSLPEVVANQNFGEERNDASITHEKEVALDTQKELALVTEPGRRLGRRWISLIAVILIVAIEGGTVGGILGYKSTFVETYHG